MEDALSALPPPRPVPRGKLRLHQASERDTLMQDPRDFDDFSHGPAMPPSGLFMRDGEELEERKGNLPFGNV